MKRNLPEDPAVPEVPAPSLNELALRASLPLECVKDIIQYSHDHTYIYFVQHEVDVSLEYSIEYFKKATAHDPRELFNFLLKDDRVISHLFIQYGETWEASFESLYGHPSGYSKRFTKLEAKFGDSGTEDIYEAYWNNVASSERKIASGVRMALTEKELFEFVWKSRGTITITRFSDFREMTLQRSCVHDTYSDECSMECDIVFSI